MHVAIDARLLNGTSGGVQQVVLGLAEGFRERNPTDLRRSWIVFRGHADWLVPTLPPGDERLEVGTPVERAALRFAAAAPRLSSRLRPFYERLRTTGRGEDWYPFDRELRRRGVDVVHLPFQDGFPTELPTIYQPHDLQHLHLPQYFTEAQICYRETVWRTRARTARFVVVGTRWVALDVAARWGIPSEKLRVIPLAPLSSLATTPEVDRARPVGPDPFVLYPAAFWPHKNHAALVEAVAVLHKRGVRVRAVLPGVKVGEAPRIEKLASSLGIRDQVEMPGFVLSNTLAELYRDAAVVCVPTLFEAASFPIWEAFRVGTPVAASNVMSLPDQLGDAGLLFDPSDPNDIADQIDRLLRDVEFRDRCVQIGTCRIKAIGWDRTALAFMALYRIAAGETPREEEQSALDAEAVL